MVRPKLPAVVRSGDRFEVAALLTASGAPLDDVRVGLAAKGLAVEGAGSAVVDLEVDVARRVVFHVRAERVGPFELKLRASSKDGQQSDAVVSRGEVVAPTFVETVALYGDATAPVAEALGDMSAIREDVGELTLTLTLARTRLAGLDRDIGGLLEYPYGCTEQTASRLLPLASLRGLSSEVGVSLPADAAKRVADAIERLRSHQQRNGGFGFWPESRASDPWLSAYATWVLLEVRRSGTSVPGDLLDRAKAYLRAYLEHALPSDDPGAAGIGDRQLVTAAFVVDVLAGTASRPTAAMDRLFAVRDRLPPFAAALLLHALSSSPDAVVQQRVLLNELTAKIQLDGDGAHVGLPAGSSDWLPAVLASEIRSTALVLRALLAVAPDHPMAPKLVTGLLSGLRARTATTHERAWALVALDAYRRAHPTSQGALEARVFLGKQLVGEVDLERDGASTEAFLVPAAEVVRAGQGARLTFDVEGGQLHYQARLHYARRQLPTKPTQAGMQIFKRLHRVDPFTHEVVAEGDMSLALHAGDLVRVDLQVVTTSSRRVVAVDDPLPGGLVPIDPSLRSGLREDRAVRWDHRELRDDRVVFFVDALPAGIHRFSYWARAQNPGRFVAPPAQTFEMYAPEIRGATAAATITVRPR